MKIKPGQIKSIIFAGIRIGGPVATFVLSIKAGEKVERIKKHTDYSECDGGGVSEVVTYDDLSKKDKFKIMAPVLAPGLISCSVTIVAGCIDKHLDTKALRQMAAYYSTAIASSYAYRNKLLEVNKEAADEVDEHLLEEAKQSAEDVKSVPWVETPEESLKGGDTIFVDSLTGRMFKSTIENVQEALRKAEYDYNNNDGTGLQKFAVGEMQPTKYLALNDLYGYLGIEHTFFGQQFGYVGTYDKDTGEWDYCGGEIHFNIIEGRNGYFYIDYSEPPVEGWYEI